MNRGFKILLLLVAVLATNTVSAQWRDALYDNASTEGHLDLGVTGGLGFYHGDLEAEWFPMHDANAYTFGLYFKKFRNQILGYRFGINYFMGLNAHDSTAANLVDVQRNLRFETNLLELNAGVELNILKFGKDYNHFTPFVFGGFNLFYFNPFADTLGGYGKIHLKPLGTEGQNLDSYPDRVPYNLVSTGLYFGGGFKFLINKQILVGLEVGFRYNATDYLDDVSRTYVNLDTLANIRGVESANYAYRGDELFTFEGDYPKDGYIRGNSDNSDWYYSGNLTIGYYFDLPQKTKRYPYTKCVDTKESNPKAF